MWTEIHCTTTKATHIHAWTQQFISSKSADAHTYVRTHDLFLSCVCLIIKNKYYTKDKYYKMVNRDRKCWRLKKYAKRSKVGKHNGGGNRESLKNEQVGALPSKTRHYI